MSHFCQRTLPTRRWAAGNGGSEPGACSLFAPGGDRLLVYSEWLEVGGARYSTLIFLSAPIYDHCHYAVAYLPGDRHEHLRDRNPISTTRWQSKSSRRVIHHGEGTGRQHLNAKADDRPMTKCERNRCGANDTISGKRRRPLIRNGRPVYRNVTRWELQGRKDNHDPPHATQII